MFSYVDPTIKERLEKMGRLIHVDRTGERLGPDEDETPHMSLVGPVPLPVRIENEAHELAWWAFVRRSELSLIERAAEEVRQGETKDLVPLLSTYMQVSSILILGDLAAAESPLVRLHSCCMTSDVFGSLRCECGPQLRESFKRIGEEGVGAVIYLSSHEGRGIGLWAKAITYLLQDLGQDTYQANRTLGLPDDSREFTDAAVALQVFRPGDRPIRLLTNNPLKTDDLQRGGVTIAEVVPLVAGVSSFNRRYLKAKAEKGHTIPPEEI